MSIEGCIQAWRLDLKGRYSIVRLRIGLFVLILEKGSGLCCLGGQNGWSGRHPVKGIALLAKPHRIIE